MYLKFEMQLGEDGEITLICDTSKSPYPITLELHDGEKKIEIDRVESHKLGQFILNCRRILTMIHEDDSLNDPDEDDEDGKDE